MAKFIFGMNQSLDGYVDHTAFSPGPKLFRHFVDQVGALTGSIYGRTMYEVMRYWDEESADWSPAEHDFAVAWRRQPKWVLSRSLTSVGPNATLVSSDFEAVIRRLKAQLEGDVEIAGTLLAQSLTDLGLIDQYNLYLHPVVLGSGTPYFAGPRPRLRLAASQQMDEDVIKLSYVPAQSPSRTGKRGGWELSAASNDAVDTRNCNAARRAAYGDLPASRWRPSVPRPKTKRP